MLSRVADSLYWMSRYIERAENVARFVEVNLHLMLDLPNADGQWQPLIRTTGDEKAFAKCYPDASRDNVIRFLTFDAENPNSILSCVRFARENARSIREIISSEMWERVNAFYLMLTGPQAATIAAESPYDFYNAIKNASHLFCGVSEVTLSHNEGWHFIRLGRLLERADKTSRILDVKYFILLPKVEDVGMPLDAIQWAALLKSASALEMFRKHFAAITPRNVSEFLILNREFPRAVLYCLLKAEESVHAITGSPPGRFANAAERSLGRLQSNLSYARIDDIIKSGMHEFLDDLQVQLNDVDHDVFRVFFESMSDSSSQVQNATQ